MESVSEAVSFYFLFLNHHLKIFYPLMYRESRKERGREKREKEREREREKNIYVRQTPINWLSPIHVPTRVGIKPVTQVRTLNQESNLRPFGPRADILTTEPN